MKITTSCFVNKNKYFILFANNKSQIGDINILFYFSIYVVVVGRDKNKGIDIDDLFYVLSPIFFISMFYLHRLNDKWKMVKLSIFNKFNFFKLGNLDTYLLQRESIFLRLRLGGENGMKWKGMKRIILEYSSIPLFRSFNGGNRKLIPLFESLSRREWNG